VASYNDITKNFFEAKRLTFPELSNCQTIKEVVFGTKNN